VRAQSPMAIGPLGPEVLSYELARRCFVTPGSCSTRHAHDGSRDNVCPLFDRVTGTILVWRATNTATARSRVEAFTPRASARMEETIDIVINDLIDRVADAGRCDFVTDVARPTRSRSSARFLARLSGLGAVFTVGGGHLQIVRLDSNLIDEQDVVMRAWTSSTPTSTT